MVVIVSYFRNAIRRVNIAVIINADNNRRRVNAEFLSKVKLRIFIERNNRVVFAVDNIAVAKAVICYRAVVDSIDFAATVQFGKGRAENFIIGVADCESVTIIETAQRSPFTVRSRRSDRDIIARYRDCRLACRSCDCIRVFSKSNCACIKCRIRICCFYRRDSVVFVRGVIFAVDGVGTLGRLNCRSKVNINRYLINKLNCCNQIVGVGRA